MSEVKAYRVRKSMFCSSPKCKISLEYDRDNVKRGVCFKCNKLIDEYIEEMQARTGKRVSVPTLWRSLAYCGITRKKVNVLSLLETL